MKSGVDVPNPILLANIFPLALIIDAVKGVFEKSTNEPDTNNEPVIDVGPVIIAGPTKPRLPVISAEPV